MMPALLFRKRKQASCDTQTEARPAWLEAQQELERLERRMAELEEHPSLHCVGVDENNDCCGVTFTCPPCRARAKAEKALEI